MEPIEISSVQFTPCIHGFHKLCIAEWLKTKYHEINIPCPTCKSDISPLLYELSDLINIERPQQANDVFSLLMQFNPTRVPTIYIPDGNQDQPSVPIADPYIGIRMPQPIENILNSLLAIENRQLEQRQLDQNNQESNQSMFDFPIRNIPLFIFEQSHSDQPDQQQDQQQDQLDQQQDQQQDQLEPSSTARRRVRSLSRIPLQRRNRSGSRRRIN